MLAQKMIMQETDIIMYDFTGINIHLIRIPVIESFLGSNMKQSKSVWKKKREEDTATSKKIISLSHHLIIKGIKPSSIESTEIIVSYSYNSENVQH